MTQDVLQFYGLPFDPSVEEFLDSHTKLDIGGVSSTFRDSKSAPFHWIKDLSFDEVRSNPFFFYFLFKIYIFNRLAKYRKVVLKQWSCGVIKKLIMKQF